MMFQVLWVDRTVQSSRIMVCVLIAGYGTCILVVSK